MEQNIDDNLDKSSELDAENQVAIVEMEVEDIPSLETTWNKSKTELDKYPSDYFLNKHSPSFICLEQYPCSQSILQLNLNFFPPLQDPGLDAALNAIPSEPEMDPTGTDRYLNLCKELSIVPMRRVTRSLGTEILNLKYYGLTLKQMRAITDALKVNSNITHLVLEDSWMSPEATTLISEILRESKSITTLNLRECRIGIEGAERLCEGISSSQFLQELDLSFNGLGDEGLMILKASLIENTSIKKLNLSHNMFTEASGEVLEEIFLGNKSLEELNLSWNGFYTGPGNKKLFNGLLVSDLLTSLDLSWNGIGTGPSMRPIAKYLKNSNRLRFIDLSWNQITQTSLKLLRGALSKNTSLEWVKIGNNIYTPEEAYSLANVLSRTETLKMIDMENMCVNKDFLDLKVRLRKKGKTVIHGRVLSNYKIYGPNVRKLLFDRCKYLALKPKRRKAKKDFGHFVLSLPDKPISTQQLQEALKKWKIKTIAKDKDLVKVLVSSFATRSNNVDCATMKSEFMVLYPDTTLPPEKKKKRKKKKKKRKRTQT